MVIVVIGQSGSGKTTFVKKNFLQGECKTVEDIVPYTTNGEYCVIGKYFVGIRTEGTDTLSYSAGDKIRALTQKLVENNHNVVLEGDRINNRATFAFLSLLHVPVKLYLINCKLETSVRRLWAAGSKITLPFLKTTKTKSRNNFLKWGKRFNGEVVNTDGLQD